ncbi:unnamed protein product [Vicia faba]|uniref:Reverse transcriptase zinc-binding domain-containing protein n=1 Tax=Vicia faba TaxID=3906 RepID=A0AAV1ATH8_VICFA|nr:unnamed protein product [Vicia faba]
MELVDLPTGQRKFSWSRGSEKAMKMEFSCRYGSSVETLVGASVWSARGNYFNGRVYSRDNKNSLWWRDIKSFGSKSETSNDWFLKGVLYRLGSGRRILFWENRWCGEVRLKILFPILFNQCQNLFETVQEMGEVMGDRWYWKFQGEVINQSVDAQEEMIAMFEIHGQVSNSVSREDGSFRWETKIDGEYAVRDGYRVVTDLGGTIAQKLDQNEVLSSLWESKLPSKIFIFGWRYLKDRVATKLKLMCKGVIHKNEDGQCVFYAE